MQSKNLGITMELRLADYGNVLGIFKYIFIYPGKGIVLQSQPAEYTLES